MSVGRLLVIAAHADDDVLGCGATLARRVREGWDVRVAIMGEGISARYARERIRDADVVAEAAARNEDGRRACALLGVHDMRIHDLPCCRFDSIDLIDLTKMVEAEIVEFRPDVLLTHWGEDANVDHQQLFRAILPATRPGSRSDVAEIYSFEVLSSTEWGFHAAFRPDTYVVVEEVDVEQKVAAMRAYPGELRPFPHPRSEEGIRHLAATRGSQVGVPRAEAFQLLRRVVR